MKSFVAPNECDPRESTMLADEVQQSDIKVIGIRRRTVEDTRNYSFAHDAAPEASSKIIYRPDSCLNNSDSAASHKFETLFSG